MRKNHSGFGAVEGLLIVIIFGLIGAVGWYVWHTKDNVDKTYNSAANSTSKGSSSTADKDGDWTVIKQPSVPLAKWGLGLTLPAKLNSKAVYKYDSANGIYDFSLRSIVDDKKCLAYFTGTEMVPGIELGRYASSTNAHGQVGSLANDTETLGDYYSQHKAAAGNYFTDTNSSRNYYKVGDNFYVLFSYPPAFQQQHMADFTAACPNVSQDWQQDFVNAISTLSP